MKTKTKWYNDPQTVGSFLIFLPPVGIYGLYKSEAIAPKWKKIASVTIILVVILLIIANLS